MRENPGRPAVPPEAATHSETSSRSRRRTGGSQSARIGQTCSQASNLFAATPASPSRRHRTLTLGVCVVSRHQVGGVAVIHDPPRPPVCTQCEGIRRWKKVQRLDEGGWTESVRLRHSPRPRESGPALAVSRCERRSGTGPPPPSQPAGGRGGGRLRREAVVPRGKVCNAQRGVRASSGGRLRPPPCP